MSTLVYGASTVFFALSHDYLIAAPLLIVGGVANLAALSITQTVVQLRAPREKKGQVIGVYGVGANGMRIGSGFTVGLLGAAVGLRTALGWSSAALSAACSSSPPTWPSSPAATGTKPNSGVGELGPVARG